MDNKPTVQAKLIETYFCRRFPVKLIIRCNFYKTGQQTRVRTELNWNLMNLIYETIKSVNSIVCDHCQSLIILCHRNRTNILISRAMILFSKEI